MTTSARVLPVLTAAALLAFHAPSATAQPPEPEGSAVPMHGWTMTPSMTLGALWDDNVLIQGNTDSPESDRTTIANPGGSIDYNGRYSQFSAAYSGGFTMYGSFDALNSFEHTARMSAKRRISARTTLSAHQSFSASPTTEVQALVGIPFIRLGSRLANVGGGIETDLSKRTSLSAAYNFEWIRFDRDPVLGRPLVGGQSHGAKLGARRRMSRRVSATADYDVVRATVATGGDFAVQHGWLGTDLRLTEFSNVFAMVGLARLDTPDLARPRILPAWRAGMSRRFRDAVGEVSYGRTFVPSYGSGGTQTNEELNARFRVPLGRRVYTETSAAWRRDTLLLVTDDLPLTSVWLGGALGYAVRPWMRIEAFYSGLHQRVDRPGGALDRTRLGIQVSTGRPVRIH